jgi:hypothetical protein
MGRPALTFSLRRSLRWKGPSTIILSAGGDDALENIDVLEEVIE